MVPKLVRAVTQIKVLIMSYYYPQKIFSHFRSKSIAVITHNTDQQCDFGSPAYPPKNRILSPGGNLPPVWEPLG